MAIKWTPDLTVGLEHIDAQHKILFEKIDNLFEAGRSGKSKEVIGETLEFLDAYTKQHFRDEELYMANIKYPHLDQQKAAHKSFIEQIAKLKQEYNQSGGNILLIINANQTLVKWLTQHISVMDKQIGIYAKNLKK
ncbi:MAG TPA: hemerythrin family protein [Clostridiales bacterium]|nr:hemerythrin family protein [Clostridiales bacterium]